MGLPALNIVFASAANKAVKRSERGAIGMIVKDATAEANPAVVYKEKDIPESYNETTKEQIKLALKGNVNSPSKIVVFAVGTDAENYDEALKYFELKKVNWLVCPTVKTDTQEDAIAAWVEEQRAERNKVKAVLPENEADSEGIVNYATTSAVVGEKTYTAEQFCSRIAGLLAGTPATQAATFSVLEDVAQCTEMKREEIDAAIEAGKFVLYYDGEKVKVARGVNSLTTVTEEKEAPWQKIKVVEVMDMINDDLTILVEDYYIGKYTNIYDNKCLVLMAVKSYFDELVRGRLLESYEVDFNAEKIREYLVTVKGMDRDAAEAMPDEEVKKQYTDEKIFLSARLSIADVMEDIYLDVAV